MSEPIPEGLCNYPQLRDAELETIRIRRKFVANEQSQTPTDPPKEIPDSNASPTVRLENDLIGLALSGGGIRSAVFNLGFLQAISHRGFLRYVDYLCSVSGGGYVAGHLSALANSVTAEKNFHEIKVEEHEGSRVHPIKDEKLAHLGVDSHGRLTNSYRFFHIGSYLFSDIAGFAWRYILFTSITVLLVLSLLGVVASGAALVWRALDLECSRDVISFFGIYELGQQLGIGDETLIAFLPTLIPMGLLVVCAICRSVCHKIHSRRGRDWFADGCRFWLRCWGVSIAISFAVLFGNGEMSFTMEQSLDSMTGIQSNFVWPLIALVCVSLLPFVRFKSVIDSARADSPAWKGLIAVGLATLTCGAGPFFMVFWMARENVSGYANYRDPTLLRNDIQDWPAFDELCALVALNKTNGGQSLLPKGQLSAIRENQELYDRIMRGSATVSPDDVKNQSWDTHENLPFQSLSGALDRGAWLWQYVWNYPIIENTTDNPQEFPKSNPIGHYRKLINNQREGQDNVLKSINLAEEDLTYRLIALSYAILAKESDRSLANVGIELAKKTREPGNVAHYWHLAMLDSFEFPKNEGVRKDSVRNALQFEAIKSFLLPQLKNWKNDSVAKFNRLLLEALFPDVIRPRNMISTTIVPLEDQWCRFQWFIFWSVMAFALMYIDWNVISPFYAFYRNKLSRSFVRSAGKLPPDPNFEEQELRLQDLEPWKRGAPFPLMLASMHFFRNVSTAESIRMEVAPPEANSCHPFSLSPLFCGSAITGWQPTKTYCGGGVNLSDAIALSGAAVTPFMVSNLGITAMMAAANLRIGQWLPLPRVKSQATRAPYASGWKVGRELLSGLGSTASPKDYLDHCQMALVADGGFHEFFGLEELLLRRCRLVLVVDAGCNNGRFEFGALADALRLMRISHGLEFLDLDHEQPVDLGLLRRGDTPLQSMHHLCFRVRYPDEFPVQNGPAETIVVYAQMSLTGDEELDLQQFRNVNPNFPDEPTTNQRYSEDQVESYRQLGFHIGEIVCRSIPEEHAKNVTASDWIAWFCEGYVSEWRRMTGMKVPALNTTAQATATINDEFQKINDAITTFLSKSKRQAEWHKCLSNWFETGKRPTEFLGDEPFPNAMQIAELVLACEAYVYRGCDITRSPVFHPGGRARLTEFAQRTVQREILERAIDNASKVRRQLSQELRNVGITAIRSGANTAGPQTPLMRNSFDGVSEGLRLVVDLLIFWNDILPPYRVGCVTDVAMHEYPPFITTNEEPLASEGEAGIGISPGMAPSGGGEPAQVQVQEKPTKRSK